VRDTNLAERLIATAGGILLLNSDIRYDIAGAALLAAAIAIHWFRVRKSFAPAPG
jgi:hypothetical protein